MSESRIIVFDGVCVLCSGWVRFVLKRDRQCLFQFAAMQSTTGRRLLTQHGIDPDDPITFLLLDADKPYTDTDAALRIVSQFGMAWRLFACVVGLIPRALRNSLYRWIAGNRYGMFGRRAICFLPPPNEASRFLK